MSADMYLTDMVNISDARYSLLFSFENLYGIFRMKENAADLNHSQSYDLVAFEYYGGGYSEEILKDIYFMLRCGTLDLHINDMICIRFNGKMTAFRYVHKPQNVMEVDKCFCPVPHFIDDECENYIREIHEKNMVLSVLDGKVFSIQDPIFENHRAYCVEKETFQNGRSFIRNTFSTYGLFGTMIKCLDPYGRPFISRQNVLYFIEKGSKKKNKSILLLNRRELDMLKDYNLLNSFQEELVM